MSENVKRREAAIDILKLVACVGVVVIHISGQGLDELPMGSFGWYSCVFWDGLARFAVPVFFMCTGALMLPPERELTLGRIWKKYFLRVLWILLFWAWAYYILGIVGQYILTYGFWEPNGILNSFTETLRFNHHLHLYYLQILLLLYALLPVLRVFTRAASEKELDYACGVWLILGIALPVMRLYFPFNWFGGLIDQYAINMTWSAMGYALMGYRMTRAAPERAMRSKYILLIVLGLAVTLGGTVHLSLTTGVVNTDFMEGMSPGPAAMAVGLFGLVRCLAEGRESTPRMVKYVKASFCVYLIHHAFIMVFRGLGFDVHLFAPIVQIPLETLAVLALSLAGWWVLSKIPFVKDHLI